VKEYKHLCAAGEQNWKGGRADEMKREKQKDIYILQREINFSSQHDMDLSLMVYNSNFNRLLGLILPLDVNFIILRAHEARRGRTRRRRHREIPKMISSLLLSHHYYRKIHLDGCSAALLRCDIEADMDTPMAKNKSGGNLPSKTAADCMLLLPLSLYLRGTIFMFQM